MASGSEKSEDLDSSLAPQRGWQPSGHLGSSSVVSVPNIKRARLSDN